MRHLLLLSAAVVIPVTAYAALPNPTHTNTIAPIELASISSSSSDKAVKMAAICFLGNDSCNSNITFGKGDDYTFGTDERCLNEGFIKNNCNSVQIPDGSCAYNSDYVRGCKCKPGLVTCPAGQIGVGESCNGQYASCECDTSLISCPSNKTGVGITCGGKYQGCVCKPEYQYTSSNCPSPQYLSGASCDGAHTSCLCPTGVSAGVYGCEEYYPAACSFVCKKAYPDNCHNRKDISTPYGCQQAWGDCASKCQIAYPDNCRNKTAVAAPYGCQAYFSDCSSKCQIAAPETCETAIAAYNPNAIIYTGGGNITLKEGEELVSLVQSIRIDKLPKGSKITDGRSISAKCLGGAYIVGNITIEDGVIIDVTVQGDLAVNGDFSFSKNISGSKITFNNSAQVTALNEKANFSIGRFELLNNNAILNNFVTSSDIIINGSRESLLTFRNSLKSRIINIQSGNTSFENGDFSLGSINVQGGSYAPSISLNNANVKIDSSHKIIASKADNTSPVHELVLNNSTLTYQSSAADMSFEGNFDAIIRLIGNSKITGLRIFKRSLKDTNRKITVLFEAGSNSELSYLTGKVSVDNKGKEATIISTKEINVYYPSPCTKNVCTNILWNY